MNYPDNLITRILFWNQIQGHVLKKKTKKKNLVSTRSPNSSKKSILSSSFRISTAYLMFYANNNWKHGSN